MNESVPMPPTKWMKERSARHQTYFQACLYTRRQLAAYEATPTREACEQLIDAIHNMDRLYLLTIKTDPDA